MQTFLPYPDFAKSAASLDMKRLGKQRVEAWTILRTLASGGEYASSWKNHPAVRMWRGYEPALRTYTLTMIIEWIKRGYEDNLWDQVFDLKLDETRREYPPWLGNEDFHRSHRANLVGKFPEFYIPQFGKLKPEPYVWPVEKDEKEESKPTGPVPGADFPRI